MPLPDDLLPPSPAQAVQDQIDDLRVAYGLKPRKRRPAHPPLPEAQQQSIVNDVLNKGVGLLQWGGETLDKPGRAVRGLLAGQPGELANLIPFSDTLGITDPSQSVSGKDLLQQYGLQEQGATGFLPAAMGFGAEVLTDPTTYLTLGAGALSKAGKAAKAAGVSVKGATKYKKLADVVDLAAHPHLAPLAGEQLGGALGFHVPFTQAFDYVPEFAKTQKAQQAAGLVDTAVKGPFRALGKIPLPAGLDEAGQMKTLPLGRVASAAFDPSVGGHVDPLRQDVARRAYDVANKGKTGAIKEFLDSNNELIDLTKEFEQSYGHQFSPSFNAADAMKRIVQHAAEKKTAVGVVDELTGLKVAPAFEQKVGTLADRLKGAQDMAAQEYAKRGGNIQMMKDAIGHIFRQTTVRPKDEAELFSKRILGVGASGAQHRVEAIRDIPAEYVNRMLKDGDVIYENAATGAFNSPAQMKQALLAKYGQPLQTAATAANKSADDMAGEVASYIRTKGEGFFKNDANLFGADVTKNHYTYLNGMNQGIANMDAVHSFLHANLNDLHGVPLSEAFQTIGMKPQEALAYFTGKFGPNAANMMVPKDVVDAARSVVQKSTSKSWMGQIADSMIQMFKRNLTLPFPAFHVRNWYSGQWMNMASNLIQSPADLAKYRQAYGEAMQIVGDQAKHRDIITEMLMHRAIPLEFGARDVDLLSDVVKQPFPENLGMASINPLKTAKNVGATLGRETMAGFAARRAEGKGVIRSALGGAYGALHETGAEAAKQIEYLNRAPMYLYLRKQGWTAEAAAAKVRELQIDYSDLTPFEKSAMKRVVPFYSFTRKAVPEMIKQVFERPGGVTAQTIRASNIGRNEGDFIPAYIGEGMSVPIGDNSYLSQLGLPTDNFSDLAATGPSLYGTVRRTLQKLGSQTAPPIKGLAELTTGRNLFTGKDLTDLYQSPTNSVLANQLLSAFTPGSRYFSVARTLGDERKTPLTRALNTLTGVKISTPSGGFERQKDYAAKKIMEEILREQPGLAMSTDLYVKEGQKLSPRAEELYRAYRGVIAKQEKAKREKKKQKQKAAL